MVEIPRRRVGVDVGRAARKPVDMGSPKVMFYCHDTYGLGHLRRTLTLARYVREHTPSVSQLIVTGSPVAQSFALPEGADYIKLPSVVKVGADEYEARSVSAPFSEIRDLRREILLSAARHFRPDALIVDHAPTGLKGECIATLRYLKENAPNTRLILGLRDIMDEAAKVRKTWAREGVYELLDNVYDLILVYGNKDVYDIVEEYGLPSKAAAKTHYVGYLGREPGARSSSQVRAELNMRTDRLVVVTVGGGGDGHDILRTAMNALRLRPEPVDFDCLLVGGPLMSAQDRDSLMELADPHRGIHFLSFASDMTSYIGAADVVVSMGGYNSICEILSLGRPSIVVPRVAPRKEQLIRAEALHNRGLLQMIHPDDLSPERLLDEIELLLRQPTLVSRSLSLDGLPSVGNLLDQVLAPDGVFKPRFMPSRTPGYSRRHKYLEMIS